MKSFILLITSLVATVHGHGYLIKPSSRTRLGAEVGAPTYFSISDSLALSILLEATLHVQSRLGQREVMKLDQQS